MRYILIWLSTLHLAYVPANKHIEKNQNIKKHDRPKQMN